MKVSVGVREGDYWTSPERSVLFAATFANYFARLFHNLGSPESWVVLEAGAGSGKFAEGVLDTLRLRSPDVFKATRYLIDELSPSSRALAAERLARFGSQVEFARMADLEEYSDRSYIFERTPRCFSSPSSDTARRRTCRVLC